MVPPSSVRALDSKLQGKKTYSVVASSSQRTVTSSHSSFTFSKTDYYEFDTAKPVKGIAIESLLDDADEQFLSKVAAARSRLSEELDAIRKTKTLKSLRLAAGLSQVELAGRIGSTQPYISRLEQGGGGNPSSGRVRELAVALGVSSEEVLGALHAKV